MSRLRDEAWRLDPASYPFAFQMRTAFGDMDSFRHLNNVALVRYLEEARASLNMHLFGEDALVRPSGERQLLMASTRIEYVNQGRYPGQIEVATGILRAGRSSFTHAAALFQDGLCIALGDSVMVHAVDGLPAPVAEDAKERFAQIMIGVQPCASGSIGLER